MLIRLNCWLGVASLMILAATAQESIAQTLTTLLNFDGPDGALPVYAPLLQARDGNLYGTAAGGGPPLLPNGYPGGWGTVFKITPAGTLTTLHKFAGPVGSGPTAGMIQTADGSL